MKPDYDFDLLCIGSGPAGQRAAIQAAKLGKRAAVVEKRPSLGGVCLEIGTIPSKTFREAVWGLSQSGGGLTRDSGFRVDGEPLRRPPIEALFQRVGMVGQRESQVVEQQLFRNEVQIIRGEASFVHPHTLLVVSGEGQRTVTAENIVIAVGTYPASPPGVPADGDLILTSDDLVRLRRLPKKLVVVGGGIIGIEYASMFAALQIPVILVDKRDRLLEFLDRESVVRTHAADEKAARHVTLGRGCRAAGNHDRKLSPGGRPSGVRENDRLRRNTFFSSIRARPGRTRGR